jgi:hypothetical protein
MFALSRSTLSRDAQMVFAMAEAGLIAAITFAAGLAFGVSIGFF